MAEGLLTSADDAVLKGLQSAYGLMGASTTPYPTFVPSQTKAPTQTGYINYTPNQPMAQVQTPNYKLNSTVPTWNSTQFQSPSYGQVNTQASAAGYNYQDVPAYQRMAGSPTYQGLMGGDYAALQAALQTPGEIAARRAYEQGQTNLTNTMGGRGLYGSSIMANQARTALETPYMDTLAANAANAAAQRYNMQASDLQNRNNFGLNIYGQQMSENQNANNAALQNSMARNTAGLDYAKLLTGVNQQNTQNAMTQQQALNALRSGDTQALNSLLGSQGLAQNAFNQNTYNQQMAENQNMNQFNLQNAQLGVQQNQNLYNAGSQDAASRNAYNLAQLNYQNQQEEALRAWENQRALEQFQYELASKNYTDAQRTQMINEFLALAGRGQVSSAQNQAAQTAANQTSAQQQAGLLGFLGSLAGNINYSNGNWSWG